MNLPRKWKMKSGEKIWIKDMSDSHLENTIKMIERKVEEYNLEVWTCDLDGFNPRYHEIDLSDPEEYPQYTALINERDKRK